MTQHRTNYDVVIIGAGHNGLVAAAYLSKAGMSVLVLERSSDIGGATCSRKVFPGYDAKLSVYSYLISLFPEKIAQDLGLDLELRARSTASWTPLYQGKQWRELLVRNNDPSQVRDAMVALTGSDHDYRGFQHWQQLQSHIAAAVWPTMLQPLLSREQMFARLDTDGRRAWQTLIENPIGQGLEDLIKDDLIRGMIFTDAKIGLSTWPYDPSLRQNRCFLYHVIGRGNGQWNVPVGGMAELLHQLRAAIVRAPGQVTICCHSEVNKIHPGDNDCAVVFDLEGVTKDVSARYVLCNASRDVLDRLRGREPDWTKVDEGAGFKINMLLHKLPRLRSETTSVREALAGTVHIDEGYEQMQVSYRESSAGRLPAEPPGEIYCHTLTDPSILSKDLFERGFHTITLFGLDLPYSLFTNNNESQRNVVVERFLAGINKYLKDPIEECLAIDENGHRCLEAMSAVDLEETLHLPKGNIFHGDLSWPFAETEEEVGTWGVETDHPRVLCCGSSARRGGAVSGIPGHNAAMKVLESAKLFVTNR